MIIIINGSGGCGKDTFIEYVIKHSEQSIYNISTVDWIKEFCKIQFSIDPSDKSLTNRAKWHEEKMHHSKFIFYEVCREIDKVFYNHEKGGLLDPIVFIHCRESKEISKFIENYKNCLTLLIRRDSIQIPDNFADQDVENYDYDIVIDNNEEQDALEAKAVNFLEEEIVKI